MVGTGGAAVPIQLGEPLASWVLDPDLDKYRIQVSRDADSVGVGSAGCGSWPPVLSPGKG